MAKLTFIILLIFNVVLIHPQNLSNLSTTDEKNSTTEFPSDFTFDPETEERKLAREEKFRTALIDAFQAIKKASSNKGSLNEHDDSKSLNNMEYLNQMPTQRDDSNLADTRASQATETSPKVKIRDEFDEFFADGGSMSVDADDFRDTTIDAGVSDDRVLPQNIQNLKEQPKPANSSPISSLLTKISQNIRHSFNDSRNPSEKAVLGSAFDPDKIGIDNVMKIFNVEILMREWPRLRRGLEPKCIVEVETYLRGLVEQKVWALKMDDASGRYTSAFFWGNSYWTGSAELCASLNEIKTEEETSVQDKGDDWRHLSNNARPPFETAFFMLRLLLNSSDTIDLPRPRTIHLGLCLPYACTVAEVGRLVSSAPPLGVRSQLLAVRSPSHSHYDMTKDRTFQILFVFIIFTVAMLAAGTSYDVYLSACARRRRSAARRRGAAADTLLAGKTSPLSLRIDAVQVAKGKSVYHVNNNNNNAEQNNNSEERLTVESASTEDQPLKLGIISEIVLSFSLKANIKTIMDQSVGSDTIPTVHGLKSVSMLWVIMGHACIVGFKYSDNTEVRKIVEKEFIFQTVLNGPYSVDTFFCISGLLVSYIYFRTNEKGSLERLTKGRNGFTSGLLQWLGLIAYRFARLTTPYLVMLGVVEISMKWFYHNSVFEPPTDDHINCPNYWWRNILYINTLFPVEQMCMLWSWYLADDSQFYALGAVILILAASHFKMAAVAMSIFMVSSWITTGYISWINNHIPSTDDPLALFDKIYDKPWTRLGPYLVGMITGWILFKTNCRIRMSKITVTIGWSLSLSALLFMVYGLYNTQLTLLVAAVYSSLSHTVWAMAVGWIIIACSTGYGGYVNTILSAPVLYPFSRVTYCAYLVHPVTLRFLAMHLDHPMHLGKEMMLTIFLGQAVLAFSLSFIISVAFEAPVVTMLKILSPHKKPRKV